MNTNYFKILFAVGCILSANLLNHVFSQLNGTYTVGGVAPNYATVNDAVNDLNSMGISGNVTFNIRDGVYAGDNMIFSFPGNATFSTTFQSESGNAANVTVAGFGSAFQIFSANNITLRNMTLIGANSGVEIYSTDNTGIIGNRIQDFSIYGILANTDSNSRIEGNSITTQAGFNPFGIYSYGSSGNTMISKNKIDISGGVDSPSGIIIDASATQGGGTTLASNNFVATSGLSGAYGIQVYAYVNSQTGAPVTVNVIFNSVNVYGASENEATAFFMLVDGVANDVHIVDNVFANNNNTLFGQTNNNASRVNLFSPGGTIVTDYNDYFLITPGGNLFMDNGTPSTTLAAHQTLTGRDAHSINVNPNYASPTDLHTTNSALAAGTPWPGITTDIDGQTRNATTPWMGADENISNFACGNNKVLICHRPPGNPNNAHTICVSAAAANAHLAHGCTLGPCPNNKIDIYTEADMVMNVHPNPFSRNFTVEFSSLHVDDARIEVYNIMGTCVQFMQVNGMEAGVSNLMDINGATLPSGIYFIRFSSGGNEMVQKLIKE
jgi:hypothetical protein